MSDGAGKNDADNNGSVIGSTTGATSSAVPNAADGAGVNVSAPTIVHGVPVSPMSAQMPAQVRTFFFLGRICKFYP